MSFYMNMTLNEGQQKDDYIKRKEEEKKKENRRESFRTMHRSTSYGAGYKIPKGSSVYDRIDHAVSARTGYNSYPSTVKDQHKDNYDRVNASHIAVDGTSVDHSDPVIYNKDKFKKFNDGAKKRRSTEDYSVEDANRAADALDRHKRRHPKQYKESGIFSECNFIEFAY